MQELAPRKVRLIKTWVDDRGGAVKKLTPELYGAIIDEAHKNDLRVAVHATGLQDAKDLLRAGIDVFAHMISDVDDELVALFKQHPEHRRCSRRSAGRTGPCTRRGSIRCTRSFSRRCCPNRSSGCRSRFPADQTPAQLAAISDAWDRLARGIARLTPPA